MTYSFEPGHIYERCNLLNEQSLMGVITLKIQSRGQHTTTYEPNQPRPVL